jgi:ATP-dependent helicase/nuclease subunit A
MRRFSAESGVSGGEAAASDLAQETLFELQQPAEVAEANAAPPPPTPEQRAAIEDRDRDVFCEAGAGTGKTRVLVERYCAGVEEDRLGPEAILAFTFTERAASELRTRIRHELTARAKAAREAGDEELETRLRRAARETERAWVTTIHGFCRRLLAGHPTAAGIDPRFRVLDEGEAGRLQRRARDQAVEDVLRDGDVETVDIVAAYKPRRFGELAVAAHERLRSQGMAEPALPPVTDPVRSAKQGEDSTPQLTPAERDGALRARAALEALLQAFHRRYEELKATRSALDFADLELGALALLRDSPVVAEAWRGRFAHVMVDEFQDTNRVQLDLVEALRGPETRVFRVGDELQSIYRFRNADLAIFRDERARAEADAATAVLPLTGNFRSRPEIVAAVNAVGEALVGEDFRPLAAARSNAPASDGDKTPIELLLTLEEGRSNGWAEHAEVLRLPPSERQPKYVAEARALARRLRELVDAGEARRGDIVVLLRAFTHVDAYEEALERAGLDPYVVGGRGYWSQQQVEDMLRLLSAIANPLDDEMLLGALACPAVGVSPDALWLLRRAATEGRHLWPLIAWRFGDSERVPEPVEETWLDQVPGEDAERLERFCSTLAGLRAAAPVVALDELVERTMTDFGYDLALLARRRGRGRMANVRKLIRLAREFEAHEGRDLRGFLVAAEELTGRDEREGVAATQPEDHDGVRVMTVHAAKGLEFPTVAVPDLGRGLAQGEYPGDILLGRLEPGANGNGSAAARFGLRLVLPAEQSFGVWELHELHAENVAEAADEGCRLVHVAATRAEERLILSGLYRSGDLEATEPAPNDTALRRLVPALRARGWDPEAADGEVELVAPEPAAGAAALTSRPRLAIRVNAPGAERAAQLAERLDPPPRAPEQAELRPPPLARPPRITPVGHLSYSALAEYERCAYRFYVERLLGLDAPPAPLHPDASADADPGAEATADGRARRLGLGNAVHAALEWSARRGWKRPGADQLASLLGQEGLGDDAELAARAGELVDAWLGSDLLAELRAADLRTEVPFALSLAGSVVRGQIDLLAGGPEPTVLDYKTDALGDAGPRELAERYSAQREIYALAAAATPGIADGAGGPASVRAVHVFLEAPADPVVESFDRERLDRARARLESLVSEIRAGGNGFRPTNQPSWQVCNGCPAAARLCPHPGWRPRG